MTVKEMYLEAGGNYDEVMERLMKEDRVVKFLKRFTEMPDYAELQVNLEAQNWPDAFRNVHTIKGNALNLSLTALAQAASALCEELRPGAPSQDTTGMAENVTKEYKKVIELIGQLD